MTDDEMKNLRDGDVVAHKSGGDPCIVTGNYGDHVTAVRTVDITNPIEWELRSKAIRKTDD